MNSAGYIWNIYEYTNKYMHTITTDEKRDYEEGRKRYMESSGGRKRKEETLELKCNLRTNKQKRSEGLSVPMYRHKTATNDGKKQKQ